MTDNFKFYLVDDDPAVIRKLSNIIEEESLGEVVGQATNGYKAIDEIPHLSPNLIIMDLLMPDIDGIETINQLLQAGFEGSIILLSQVTDKAMVTNAYHAGVEFYLTKPLNKIEVAHVINKVIKHHNLEQAINQIKSTINDSVEQASSDKTANENTINSSGINIRIETEKILMALGVLNNSGSKDILKAIQILSSLKHNEALRRLQNLKLLYQEISTSNFNQEMDLSMSVNAIERRIRRTIEYALTNLAALGVEDYHHPKFERFSYHFFDFTELRKEMARLQGKDNGSPKINVKKFLEGILYEIGRF